VTGSVSRVAFESLKTAAGIDMLEVPYKGAAPATADLLTGWVDMGLAEIAKYADIIQRAGIDARRGTPVAAQ
jgi:tripartite-type tricarboxylate transporter receptor subunit TctC